MIITYSRKKHKKYNVNWGIGRPCSDRYWSWAGRYAVLVWPFVGRLLAVCWPSDGHFGHSLAAVAISDRVSFVWL